MFYVTVFSWALVFFMHQQKWSQIYFILYPLFILIPRYLRQLPFYPRYSGQDTDAVTAISIAITCPFLQGVHRSRHHRRFHKRKYQPSKFLFLVGRKTEQGDRWGVHKGAPLPNHPTPVSSLPPHLPLITFRRMFTPGTDRWHPPAHQ